MSGFGSGGMGSGGKGSGGMGGKRSGGDASGGRKHSGGVRLPQGELEAHMAQENVLSGRPGWWCSSPRRGDVAAAAAAPGPAGRISAGLKTSGSSAEDALPSLDSAARRICDGVKVTVEEQVERLVDALRVLNSENQEGAAAYAELKKLASIRGETVQILSEQLAAARHQIQVLEAPAAGSRAGHPSPGNSAGSLVVEPSRSGREQTAPPARLDDVYGKGKKPVYTTNVEQKSLTELLSWCFNSVEVAIRKVPVLDLVPRNDGRPTRDQNIIIEMLQKHLLAKKAAYELLKDEEARYPAIIALISHSIVDYIFKDQIIGTTANFSGRTYLAAYEEEKKAADYNHPRVGDSKYRHALAEQRAAAANALARTPGFHKWLHSTTYGTAEKIVREFAICFPAGNHYGLMQDLHKAVDDAFRIAVRMLQEPDFIEYSFPPTGTPWASDYHIHRNPELNGLTLSDQRSPYCVRLAIMPLIKSKSFANNMVDLKTIHKAEVLVGDRDVCLRQADRKR